MDRKNEKKVKTKVLRVKREAPVRWELTQEDEDFLLSCNIDPT